MLYRKVPVTVEAVRYDGINKDAIEKFMGKSLKSDTNDCAYRATTAVAPIRKLIIPTLEGDIFASPGDFIIKGVKGEFYPIKAEIFLETYEPAE